MARCLLALAPLPPSEQSGRPTAEGSTPGCPMPLGFRAGAGGGQGRERVGRRWGRMVTRWRRRGWRRWTRSNGPRYSSRCGRSGPLCRPRRSQTIPAGPCGGSAPCRRPEWPEAAAGSSWCKQGTLGPAPKAGAGSGAGLRRSPMHPTWCVLAPSSDVTDTAGARVVLESEHPEPRQIRIW